MYCFPCELLEGIIWRLMCIYIYNDVCTRVANCLWVHKATRKINTKVHSSSLREYIHFFFLHDMTTTKTLHIDPVPHSFCVRSDWRRHNRLLMTSQWIDISNSLDVYFIDGGIHGRWCKKISIPWTRFRLSIICYKYGRRIDGTQRNVKMYAPPPPPPPPVGYYFRWTTYN